KWFQNDRDSLVDAETNIYAKREGEDITVRCYLGYLGSRKLLCKETCEEGNILIDTYGDEDQRGRYSIKYEYRYIGSSILDVTITKLTKSDSGLSAVDNTVVDIHVNVSYFRKQRVTSFTVEYSSAHAGKFWDVSRSHWISQKFGFT
uniref:Immunoglobulin V-set domain-containing protein n=1 Tax=Oryzias latipes TaxID=8090 RepID=A0A3B3HUH8_ORYLA